MDLLVFVAESVKAEDFYEGRTDGFAANEILKIQQVRTSYKIVFDRNHLVRAIGDALAGDFQALHLSAHGDERGISLTDSDFVTWLEPAELLRRLGGNPNKARPIGSWLFQVAWAATWACLRRCRSTRLPFDLSLAQQQSEELGSRIRAWHGRYSIIASSN